MGTRSGALANDKSHTTIFPFGAHIFRDPSLPLEQLRRDLPLLKRLGFTMVKIQESWSMDEQREGQIDLSRVTQVVSDARQQYLGVYFGVTMEQAPAWLWRKFPDAQMVYETGTMIRPSICCQLTESPGRAGIIPARGQPERSLLPPSAGKLVSTTTF